MSSGGGGAAAADVLGGFMPMLFELIGGDCIMMGHFVFLLLRFTICQVSYNHEGDREGKMGVRGGRRGLVVIRLVHVFF